MDSDGERSPGDGPALAGVVIELLPSGLSRVRLDGGGEIVAHIADRIGRNFVRVLVGDHVDVELARMDKSRGRIVGKSSGRRGSQ